MAVWNDTDTSLAYLITFRTYGTWLHGDERGSIDRFHNTFRSPKLPPNPVIQKQRAAKLKSEPVLLDAERRRVVATAIREVCAFRLWRLCAINIRTNHGHAVIKNKGVEPEKILRDLKAYSTKALRLAGLWTHGHSPWADSGSKRYLWTEGSVVNACEYVVNGQGADLPESF